MDVVKKGGGDEMRWQTRWRICDKEIEIGVRGAKGYGWRW
jgi:hypothetical protein